MLIWRIGSQALANFEGAWGRRCRGMGLSIAALTDSGPARPRSIRRAVGGLGGDGHAVEQAGFHGFPVAVVILDGA